MNKVGRFGAINMTTSKGFSTLLLIEYTQMEREYSFDTMHNCKEDFWSITLISPTRIILSEKRTVVVHGDYSKFVEDQSLYNVYSTYTILKRVRSECHVDNSFQESY